MHSLKRRMDALEQRSGAEHYVVLFGDDVDAFDALMASGDEAAALALLAERNPYVPMGVLRSHLHAPGQEPVYRIGTLIRAEYSDAQEL